MKPTKRKAAEIAAAVWQTVDVDWDEPTNPYCIDATNIVFAALKKAYETGIKDGEKQ